MVPVVLAVAVLVSQVALLTLVLPILAEAVVVVLQHLVKVAATAAAVRLLFV
jgi:hypothetical protein